MICRAVIRRVRDEFPDIGGFELFLRFWAAYPFESEDELMQQVFHEEVLRAVGRLDNCIGTDAMAETESYTYSASAFLQ